MIPLGECKDRVVYEIESRNLIVGVFVKERAGFIGIREKFRSRFLFMEYHYDTGAPYGTVRPLKELTMAPEDMPLSEHVETLDQVTRRPVAFDRPVVDGGKGWYFIDTGEASEEIDPAYIENEKLFKFLEKIEKAIITQCQKCKRRRTPSQLDQDSHCPTCRTGSAAPRPTNPS